MKYSLAKIQDALVKAAEKDEAEWEGKLDVYVNDFERWVQSLPSVVEKYELLRPEEIRSGEWDRSAFMGTLSHPNRPYRQPTVEHLKALQARFDVVAPDKNGNVEIRDNDLVWRFIAR